MSQPKRIHALKIKPLPRKKLSPATQAYFAKCDEKLGFVPNVLQAYSFDEGKLAGFTGMYNELMLGPSGLSKLEREMIAVVVSAINHCFYCLTAHGAAVRALSGDPALGELMVMNWRAAELPAKQRAMLEFATVMTEAPTASSRPTAPCCARPAGPTATSGTSPPPPPSSTCRTAWPRRST